MEDIVKSIGSASSRNYSARAPSKRGGCWRPFTGVAMCFTEVAHMQVREGLYYNPYFIGGSIAMPKMLADEGTEYDDDTEASESQQAKVTFRSPCFCGNSGTFELNSIQSTLKRAEGLLREAFLLSVRLFQHGFFG